MNETKDKLKNLVESLYGEYKHGNYYSIKDVNEKEVRENILSHIDDSIKSIDIYMIIAQASTNCLIAFY